MPIVSRASSLNLDPSDFKTATSSHVSFPFFWKRSGGFTALSMFPSPSLNLCRVPGTVRPERPTDSWMLLQRLKGAAYLVYSIGLVMYAICDPLTLQCCFSFQVLSQSHKPTERAADAFSELRTACFFMFSASPQDSSPRTPQRCHFDCCGWQWTEPGRCYFQTNSAVWLERLC